MIKPVNNFIKSVLASQDLFLAREFPGIVNGYKLASDLKIIVPQPNPVCFDIGANRGQTIALLQDCLTQPVIHAFEPASATYAGLADQSFGVQVHLHQLAFGDQVGAAEFRNYRQSELSSFLTMNPDRTENLFAQEEMVSVESVQVDTLDHFCSRHSIDRIDLLKIDTQGFEWPVLQGGTQLFSRKKIGAVLLELNFATLYEGQSDPLSILHWLRSQQMRLVDYYEKERITGKELSWTTALFMHHPQ